MQDVSIILVNYKTKDLAKDCIKSIYEKTDGLNFDIWLVDNNSDDGVKEMLDQNFPQVKFIQSGNNNGFGSANNVALRVVESKYVLLLNTDTLLKNNAIKIMFDFMEQDNTLGACGANLYDQDGKNIHSYGVFPTLKDFILKTFFLRYLFLKNEKRLKDKGFNTENDTKEVDYITGADVMIRKSVLDEVGIFNEKFFMYFEESELQYRIRQAGYKIFINPEAQIIHLHDKSPKKRERMYYEFLKSKYLYLKLCFGTKENIRFIKQLMYIANCTKIFTHYKAIKNLFSYIHNDKYEEEI